MDKYGQNSRTRKNNDSQKKKRMSYESPMMTKDMSKSMNLFSLPHKIPFIIYRVKIHFFFKFVIAVNTIFLPVPGTNVFSLTPTNWKTVFTISSLVLATPSPITNHAHIRQHFSPSYAAPYILLIHGYIRYSPSFYTGWRSCVRIGCFRQQ